MATTVTFNKDNNNNNFYSLYVQGVEKIAGKLVVAGQDKYMNNISTRSKNKIKKPLNYYKALQIGT